MVKKQQSKRQRNIKSKLMAAICMLLVSTIMMVSSTYAWFTLSTAPEVTGINTAVGANGNLEMALMPYTGGTDAIKSGTADSMASQDIEKANITWGNLVDLSKNSVYGLDKITLYPSALNKATTAEGGKPAVDTAFPLSIPVYGSDGRVSGLNSQKVVDGVYDGESFGEKITVGENSVENPLGVRALGTISGLTEQQLDYRSAMATASTAASGAQRAASDALKKEGSKLAGIAVKHATTEEGKDEYTLSDIQALQNMVNALTGYEADGKHVDGSLEMIEKAIRYYVLGAHISKNTEYSTAKTEIVGVNETTGKYNKTLADLSSYIPRDMNEMVANLNNSLSTANNTKTALDTLVEGKSADHKFAWRDFSETLKTLVNTEQMKLNGVDISALKTEDGINEAFKEYNKNHELRLVMKTGAGVYADIADFTGNYSALVTIPEITYGVTLYDVDAVMSAETTLEKTYLDAADDLVRGAEYGEPTGAGGKAMPISDFYGYIIDLAFRTNAADSWLQLQADAVDRVYEGNTANDATMGGGSTMTFKTASTSFTPAQVQALMSAIKIVFFDPTTGEILNYATLDTKSLTTLQDNSISAKLVLCDAEGVAKTGDAAKQIMKLDQNVAEQLSVLVYLDGNEVDNADVAADVAQSMAGSLNLQFSSSADLKPMEYTDLRNGAGNTTPSTPATPELIELTATTDISGASVISAAYSSGKVVVGLNGVDEGTSVKVTVGTEELTTTTITQESVVVAIVSPTSEVTSATTVTVSAAS